MKPAALLALSLPPFAQYSAKREGDLVRLEDSARQTVVLINPARGNNAFQMRVKGKDVVRFPHASMDEYLKSAGRSMAGHPLPRTMGQSPRRNGVLCQRQKVLLNLKLGNVRPGASNIPIHGFLTTCRVAGRRSQGRPRRRLGHQPPRVLQAAAVDGAVSLRPHHRDDLRLQNGALEVGTPSRVSAPSHAVAIGFHPYFQVNDAPRDQWTFGIAAKSEWLLSPTKIPTGENAPSNNPAEAAAARSRASPSTTSSADSSATPPARPPCGSKAKSESSKSPSVRTSGPSSSTPRPEPKTSSSASNP